MCLGLQGLRDEIARSNLIDFHDVLAAHLCVANRKRVLLTFRQDSYRSIFRYWIRLQLLLSDEWLRTKRRTASREGNHKLPGHELRAFATMQGPSHTGDAAVQGLRW